MSFSTTPPIIAPSSSRSGWQGPNANACCASCQSTAPQSRPARPSLGDRDERSPSVSGALVRREIGSNPGERPQHLSYLAEIQARLEVLDESEDVALRVAVRVPPPCPAMRDDDDLACAAAIFEAALRAFLAIEQPWSVAFSSTVAQ